MPVERAFQPTDPLSPAELEAILETAYVVVSADRTVREEEIEAIEARYWRGETDASGDDR